MKIAWGAHFPLWLALLSFEWRDEWNLGFFRK
jgi:hypothetical protein